MRRAGHKQPLHKSVLEKAIVNYYMILEKERLGERRVYRSREERER